MAYFRIALRLTLLFFHISYAIIFLAFYPNSPANISPRQWLRIQKWHQRLLSICGISITIKGAFQNTPCLVIANHISWIDIPAISCVVPTGFVAKAEIAKWPVIGWLTKKTACIFIERGRTGIVEQINQTISKQIHFGVNTLVFPEGTTTDGSKTKRFNYRLFKAVEHNKLPVLLLTLSYPNSPHAKFVGDMTFFSHLMDVLKEPETHVQINITATVQENLNSKDYAQFCEQKISDELQKLN